MFNLRNISELRNNEKLSAGIPIFTVEGIPLLNTEKINEKLPACARHSLYLKDISVL